MKNIIVHIKEYWIRYLMEGFVVTLSILGAFVLTNWNDSRKERKVDIEFLNNLKLELTVDINALNEITEHYKEIDEAILRTVELIDGNKENLSSEEYEIVSFALISMQVLTPIQKTASRSDLVLGEGRLERINSDLNREYLSYLEKTQSNNAIIQKLGETLQTLDALYVYPLVRYNFIAARQEDNSDRISAHFEFADIADSHELRNALQRSYQYREVYLRYIEELITKAGVISKMIDTELEGS